MSPAFLLAALLALAPPGDPLDRLQVWIQHARMAPRWADFERQEELRGILGELRILRANPALDPSPIDLGLVQLASLGLLQPERIELAAGARMGRAELVAELARPNEVLPLRLAREVLAPEAHRPRVERLLAAELLRGARDPAVLDVLRATAREPDGELARSAQEALCGWPHPGAHLFFLQLLERDPSSARLVAQHFERTRPTLDGIVLDLLQEAVARRYLSGDWREAARARALLRGLDTPRAVPILIEALATWDRRTRAGTGSKRIRAEILQELQTLSGRTIGPDPSRWSEWWRAVQDGRVALPSELLAAGGDYTRAAFFGLKAESDRILFLVDRSGSMSTVLGTGERSRHEQAIEELTTFLTRSGADTRFNVAVFGDDGDAWRSELAPATADNVDGVRRWLEAKKPEGWTMLFEGLRAGLGLDSKGHLAPERCAVDTVIVLCDGATTEGSGWVARWLAEENGRAELVFHCVQIGGGGNGTLEALAEGTGGQLVRVRD